VEDPTSEASPMIMVSVPAPVTVVGRASRAAMDESFFRAFRLLLLPTGTGGNSYFLTELKHARAFLVWREADLTILLGYSGNSLVTRTKGAIPRPIGTA
jgi:hypothetical protein